MIKKVKKVIIFIKYKIKVMRQSWKLPYIAPVFFNNNFKKKSRIITEKRNSLMPLKFSDKKIILYNGCWYKKTPMLTRTTLNFKLGEFIPTRMSTKYTHLKKLKKRGLRKKS